MPSLPSMASTSSCPIRTLMATKVCHCPRRVSCRVGSLVCCTALTARCHVPLCHLADFFGSVGAAYIFTPTTLGLVQGEWTQRARLENALPTPEQAFGTTVAISGQFVAIAGKGGQAPPGGQVFDNELPTAFFKPALTTMLWAQYTSQTKEHYLDGASLSASGVRVLVGAPAKEGLGNVGQVYV